MTGGSSPWGGGGRPCNGVMFKLKDDIATYEVPKNNVGKLCDVCTVASLNGRVVALLNSLPGDLKCPQFKLETQYVHQNAAVL